MSGAADANIAGAGWDSLGPLCLLDRAPSAAPLAEEQKCGAADRALGMLGMFGMLGGHAWPRTGHHSDEVLQTT